MDLFLQKTRKIEMNFKERMSVGNKMQKLRYGLTAVLSRKASRATNKTKQIKVSQITFSQKRNKRTNIFQISIVTLDQNMRKSVLLVKIN